VLWLTGADGMLGKALQRVLDSQGVAYIASSRSDANAADPDSLENFYRTHGPFQQIVHCAAYTKVDQAETESQEAWKVNALSPAVLGRLAAQEGIRLLHVSTDYVFSGTGQTPYLETDTPAPATIYGKTKAEGESRLLDAFPEACIVRTSWIFGPTGRNFVATMLELMRQRSHLRVVSDQEGRPTFAPDLAEALVKMLDWQGIYHVANSGQTNWHAFALAIREAAIKRGIALACQTIDPVTTAEYAAAAKRPSYSVLDTSKADRRRGEPLRSWQTALQEYVVHYA